MATRVTLSPVRRLLAGHALAATATSAPVPLLVHAVYRDTHSTGALAVLGAGRMLPVVLLGAVAGRLVDRLHRGRLLVAAALVRAGLTGLLAVLTLLHGPVVWLIVLAVASAAAATPAYAGAGAALGQLTSVSGRAMASLTAIETGAWVAGPALGGLALSCGAPWSAPVLAALAQLVAAALVGTLDLPAPRRPLSPGATAETASWRSGALAVVSAVVLTNVVVDGTGAVLVLLVGDGSGYGWLAAGLGSGALLALAGARLTRVRHLPLYIASTGCALAGAALVGWTPGRAMLLLVGGAAAVAVEAASTAVVLRQVPGERHGEALGVLDQVIVGGALAGTIGAPLTAPLLGPTATVLVLAALLVPPLAVLLATARRPGLRSTPMVAHSPAGEPVPAPAIRGAA